MKQPLTIDWDKVLPIGQLRPVTASGPESYTLHCIAPYWQRTHEPTKERPLPPRQVLIAHNPSLEIIETKRAHMEAILAHVFQVEHARAMEVTTEEAETIPVTVPA